MKTCALLTTRGSLRGRLPLSASRWTLVAALGLSVALLAWSDHAAAQSTSSLSTGATSGQLSSAGSAAGDAGTKIDLGSLMRQQVWSTDLTGSEVHLKEPQQSQGEAPRPRNGSAGGAPSETVRDVPKRRARASDEDLTDDSDSAQNTPSELQGIQKPPFGNSMFSSGKH
jgi:hypothetical protein